jgi:hypothetical protein
MVKDVNIKSPSTTLRNTKQIKIDITNKAISGLSMSWKDSSAPSPKTALKIILKYFIIIPHD